MTSDTTSYDWFALVDTAQDPALYPLVTKSSEWQCLVSGNAPPVVAATLPYLVRLRPGDSLTEHWRSKGQGRNWGIQLQSALSLDALRLHFKKFLTAKLPDGIVALFRFYDPRVFRMYIRTSLPEERLPWFRGVACYAVEGDRPGTMHAFRWANGRLYDGAAAID